jgi:Icc-related predicted phosphoesterase
VKILAAADVHGVRPVYEWLVTSAREHHVEAIVLAGDLLGCLDGFDSPEEAQRFESGLLVDVLDAAGVPVLYIMGNDDLVELESGSTRVLSIHGRRVRCGDLGFVGYQYSLPFMGGTFETSEEEIATDLASLAGLMTRDTIFVSHSPMRGILDPGIGNTQIGSASLADFLGRYPYRAHIHGHSHAGFGRMGRHFNVAAAGLARSMVIDLEAMEHQVLERGGLGPRGAQAVGLQKM